MDVHDAPFERAQKIALEHAHETGEDNQIHLRRLQCGDVIALGVLVQLGAEFSGLDELRGYFPFARARQNSSIINIAQNDANLCRYFPAVYGVGDGGKIRAFAGTENAQSKFIAHRDLNNRGNGQNKVERM